MIGVIAEYKSVFEAYVHATYIIHVLHHEILVLEELVAISRRTCRNGQIIRGIAFRRVKRIEHIAV